MPTLWLPVGAGRVSLSGDEFRVLAEKVVGPTALY
jgi:hypothetical protein